MIEASTDKMSRGTSKVSQVLRHLGVNAATVHLRQTSTPHLQLYEVFGLPSSLIHLIEEIPRGKGLAGEAWLTKSIVSSCNLATDARAGKGAQSLAFSSTYAIPMYHDDRLVGVLGLAFEEVTELEPDRCTALAAQVVELLLT